MTRIPITSHSILAVQVVELHRCRLRAWPGKSHVAGGPDCVYNNCAACDALLLRCAGHEGAC